MEEEMEEEARRKLRLRNKKKFKNNLYVDKNQLFRLNLIKRHVYYGYLYSFINLAVVKIFINTCVIVNIIILGMETYKQLRGTHQFLFSVIDKIFLFVFLSEFLVKLALFKSDYFKNPWNLIDFLTLITAVFDNIVIIICLNSQDILNSSKTSTPNDTQTIIRALRTLRVVSLMRALRALRVLKTLKLLTSLQIIIKTFKNSFTQISAIIILMTVIMYVFAIIGCGLFHRIDKENFGTVFSSIFTCIRLITLDDWYKIFYKKTKINNKDRDFEILLLLVYLCIYILIENFIMLNLFLAVLVDNFQLTLGNFKQNQNLVTSNIDEKNSFTSIASDNETLFELHNDNNDDEDDDNEIVEEDEFNEINGISSPFSKTIDPTLSHEQRKLLERHFQLLASIEYHMYENENTYQILEYLVEETVEEYNKY